MVNYECPRCDYETHIKTKLKRHLSRKVPCIVIKADVNRKKYISEYLYGVYGGPKVPMSNQMLNNVNKYVCKYCDISVSNRSNLQRHYGTCKAFKKKLEEEEGVDIMKQIRNEMEIMWSKLEARLLANSISNNNITNNNTIISNNSINNNIGSISNTTISNNVARLNFGNERLDHLDPESIKKLIQNKGPCGAMPELFTKIYLNDEVPENMTIKYPNSNVPKLQVHRDGKWIYEDKKVIIDQTTLKTFGACKKVHSHRMNKLRNDYVDDVGVTRKRIHRDMDNQLLTFKYNNNAKKLTDNKDPPNTDGEAKSDKAIQLTNSIPDPI